jgi:hypothetical protein
MSWSVFWIGDFDLPRGARPVEARTPTERSLETIAYEGRRLRVRRIEDRDDVDETEPRYRALVSAVKNANGSGEIACIAWEDGPDTFGHAYTIDGDKRTLDRAAIATLFEANAEAMRVTIEPLIASLSEGPAPHAKKPITAVTTPFKRRPAKLEIAYRASAEPQTLVIEMTYRVVIHNGMPEAQMRQVVKHLSLGVAGGVEFAPKQSSGTIKSGPLAKSSPGGESAKYRWTIDVRGMSPRYLRHIVSRMRLAGGPEIARSMTIRGALAPRAGDAASVHTEDIDAWMADDLAWAGAFPRPGFAVEDVVLPKGMTVRLVPAKPPAPNFEAALSELMLEWLDAVVVMPSVTQGMLSRPQVKNGKKDVTIKLPAFPLVTQPARDHLVNFLVHVHDEICPLVSVEFGFPKQP